MQELMAGYSHHSPEVSTVKTQERKVLKAAGAAIPRDMGSMKISLQPSPSPLASNKSTVQTKNVLGIKTGRSNNPSMELPPSTQPGRPVYSSSSSLPFPKPFPQPQRFLHGWRCRVWLLFPHPGLVLTFGRERAAWSSFRRCCGSPIPISRRSWSSMTLQPCGDTRERHGSRDNRSHTGVHHTVTARS